MKKTSFISLNRHFAQQRERKDLLFKVWEKHFVISIQGYRMLTTHILKFSFLSYVNIHSRQVDTDLRFIQRIANVRITIPSPTVEFKQSKHREWEGERLVDKRHATDNEGVIHRINTYVQSGQLKLNLSLCSTERESVVIESRRLRKCRIVRVIHLWGKHWRSISSLRLFHLTKQFNRKQETSKPNPCSREKRQRLELQ